MAVPKWTEVGMPPAPVQEVQDFVKRGFVNSWSPMNDQLPNLPKGQQEKPFTLTGEGSGSR